MLKEGVSKKPLAAGDIPIDSTNNKKDIKLKEGKTDHNINAEKSIPFSAICEIKLPTIETYFNWLIYVCFASYSFYSIYTQTNDPYLKSKLSRNIKLQEGTFGFYKDPVEEKISRYSEAFLPVLKLFSTYIIISRIARHFLPSEIFSLVCSVMSCVIGSYIFSVRCVLIIIGATTVILGLAQLRLHKLNFILCLIGFFYVGILFENNILIDKGNWNMPFLYPGITLTICRFISLSDYISHKEDRSLLDYLAAYQYIFYPINFCYGSLINYFEFLPQLKEATVIDWKSSIIKATKLIVFMFMFMAVNDIFHPHLYSHLAYKKYSMIKADRWGGAGLILALALDFNLEYILIYGLVNVIASLDGVKLVNWPSCVFSNYQFSQIWRTFDRGLYNFMIRHIYIPMGGNKYGMLYKLFCSLTSFSVIALYHGGSKSILIWIGLNYIQIMAETIGSYLMWKSEFGKVLISNISDRNIRRITAFLGCLMYQISVLGISFFWQSYDSAFSFAKYMYRMEGILPGLLVLNLGLYCYVNVVIDYQTLQLKKKKTD